MTYDQLLAANAHLKTRVSELEVIHMMYSDSETSLRAERDSAIKAQAELEKRVQELEEQLREKTSETEHPSKRVRSSESATPPFSD